MRNERGFTLIELIIVVAVSAIAGTMLVQILVQNNNLYFQQSSRATEGLSINTATAQISNDIKAAGTLAIGYPEAGPFQYTSNLNSIVLKLPGIDSLGNPIDEIYDYIIYSSDQTNPKIFRKRQIATPPSTRKNSTQVMLTNLSKLNFYYLDQNGTMVMPEFSKKINFVLNVSSKLGLNSQSSSGSGEILLRNN